MSASRAAHPPVSQPDMETIRVSEDAVELAAALASPVLTRTRSRSPSPPPLRKKGLLANVGLAGVARRTIGICLLLIVVFLWTASNFLASFIFSDHTYDKPFFLVYVNTSLFAMSLLPMFVSYLAKRGHRGMYRDVVQMWDEHRNRNNKQFKDGEADSDFSAGERLLDGDDESPYQPQSSDEKLSFYETAVLSFEFCMLWFLANYFASACLEYTSVASVTILTSTSSVWTLIFCAVFKVEPFSVRKLMGVMASLIGVVLISTVDLSGQSDENRGSFPHKTPGQIAIGDAMALISAIVYGMYVTVMKRRVGDEDKVDMKLFFGLVGVFNLLLLWPLFPILHWTGIEPFEMPPSGKIWIIIFANSVASFVSDICWAFAMLLTTPLIVTVGLSLNIPISLVGEMIQYGQYSSLMYWIGAAVVFVSFVFVSSESNEDGPGGSDLKQNRRDQDAEMGQPLDVAATGNELTAPTPHPA